MKNPPAVSIIIGSYNRLPFLKAALKSIQNNRINIPYEIIVIDGGSTDGSLNWLSKQKKIITIIQHNRGKIDGKRIERRSWGYFMNLGFKCAQGKYILMISDDCLLAPGAVMNGYNLFESLRENGRKIGAVAFYWRNWPEQEQYWVGLIFSKMFVNHGMFLSKALEEVGWIDEDHYHFYHADGDLCLKLWQNSYEVVDSPHSFIEHFSHANPKIRTENLKTQEADWDYFKKKWEAIFPVSTMKRGDWIFLSPPSPINIASNFPKKEILRTRVRNVTRLLKQWFKTRVL